MAFIHPDFLLQTQAARRLYHEYAESEPILDYHNHLSARDIAADRQFENLGEIWFDGDHYKWRAMRADGVAERFCTGDATSHEKFLAWARVVPHTLRNPLYHWTHLELKRYFDIDELLNPESAPRIWEIANARLAAPALSARGILKQFDVRALCTTDDPADSLQHHQTIADSHCPTRVYPTFRPDKALFVHRPDAFNAWLDQLGAQCDREIGSLDEMLSALEKRHDDFHAIGCRLSDGGFGQLPSLYANPEEAAQIWQRARAGHAASPLQHEGFSGFMMLFLGRLDARKGWTRQFHIGVRRNNNARMMKQLGPDSGFDSIGDLPQVGALNAYFDRLDATGELPQSIVYNLNPADNYALAALCGNFQLDERAGKIQMGSGWWFLDQKEGIEWQLNALSNIGLLWNFVGMLTDSRSFLSFPRHEYFRRVLCNLVGRDLQNGELPDDYQLVGAMIKKICYTNARDYLGLEVRQ